MRPIVVHATVARGAFATEALAQQAAVIVVAAQFTQTLFAEEHSRLRHDICLAAARFRGLLG
jgi:hypothetical protein